MLGKAKFTKQYKKLNEADRNKVKQYYEDMFKDAVFVDTFETAEQCLLWIREIEEGY